MLNSPIDLSGERASLSDPGAYEDARESRRSGWSGCSESRNPGGSVQFAVESREGGVLLGASEDDCKDSSQIRLSQKVNEWVRVPLTIQKVNAKLLKDEHMEDLLEQFVQLCIVQHVHDDDLKALYRDYERLLALQRYEEDDLASREIVTILVVLAVLMPYDAEQQQILHSLSLAYSRHWKYLPEYRAFLACFELDELLKWPLSMLSAVLENSLFTSPQWGDKREAWRLLLRQRVVEHVGVGEMGER